jgi:hypothetical protein
MYEYRIRLGGRLAHFTNSTRTPSTHAMAAKFLLKVREEYVTSNHSGEAGRRLQR